MIDDRRLGKATGSKSVAVRLDDAAKGTVQADRDSDIGVKLLPVPIA